MSPSEVFTVAIIDDNPGAISKLQEMLTPYDNLKISLTAAGCSDAVSKLSQTAADLIFLDFDLPDGDGRELIADLRKIEKIKGSHIVMYTGFYNRCARKGKVFEGGEDDYLLKPIDPEKLDVCIQRFFYSRRHRSEGRALKAMSLPCESNRVLVVFTTTTSEMRVIKIRDIGYFHYNPIRKAWEAALTDNTVVQLKKATSAADILSYSDTFLQTHQSYIVNFDYVMLIGKQKINLYPPFEKDEVLVGRTFLRALQAKFMCL